MCLNDEYSPFLLHVLLDRVLNSSDEDAKRVVLFALKVFAIHPPKPPPKIPVKKFDEKSN